MSMDLAIHYKLTNNLIDYLMKTEFFRWDELFAHPLSRRIFLQLSSALVRFSSCRKIDILTTLAHILAT